MKATYTRHPTLGPYFSRAPRHAAALNDEDRESESGVSFDGRSYWYQQYRYDRRDDALAYARLDQSRLKMQAGGEHHWQEAETPTAANLQLMTELGIAFDGRYYRYGDYRYDRFMDAINYAHLTHARLGPSLN